MTLIDPISSPIHLVSVIPLRKPRGSGLCFASRSSLRLDAANEAKPAVDAYSTIFQGPGVVASSSRTRQQPLAHRRLVLGGRAAIEPLVKIERERFLKEAQLDQPGGDE